MNKRKSISKAKLKANWEKEGLQEWKEPFGNLFENLSEITDRPAEKIIYGQLDIKLELFTEEELETLQKKKRLKQKAAGLDKIPRKV